MSKTFKFPMHLFRVSCPKCKALPVIVGRRGQADGGLLFCFYQNFTCRLAYCVSTEYSPNTLVSVGQLAMRLEQSGIYEVKDIRNHRLGVSFADSTSERCRMFCYWHFGEGGTGVSSSSKYILAAGQHIPSRALLDTGCQIYTPNNC